MASLKCIIYLAFLLAHLELEFVQCLSYTVKTCPPSYLVQRPQEPGNRCKNDQDCEARYPGKGLKCCNYCSRLWACVSPFVRIVNVTNPVRVLKKLKFLTKLIAKCPTNPPSSESPPGPDQECQNDTSCDAKFPGQGLKCCSDGCDFRCMPPVVESVYLPKEPLYCPRPPPTTRQECYDEYYRHKCINDAECEQKYPALKSLIKCCISKCSNRVCMIPNQGKTPPRPTYSVLGTCPVFPPPGDCPPEPDDECKDDQKCLELHPGLGLKCCLDGCDKRCVPAIGVPPPPILPFSVPGTCPGFPLPADCPPEPDDECKDDQKCSELHPGLRLKCCLDGCDKRCVPIPTLPISSSSDGGTCPFFPPSDQCPPEPDDECKNDQKCGELHPGLGLKCCLDGCDKRCIPPIAPPTGVSITPISSSSDGGTCPVFPPPADCPPEPDDECKNDQKCRELYPECGLKCCLEGCDKKCVPPIM